MQANPYNSQQSPSGGWQQEPEEEPPTSWSGYGQFYTVIVGNWVYVGVATRTFESTGGECYCLQFLYGQTRNILRKRCQKIDAPAPLTVAPPFEALPNVLQQTVPVYGEFPGATRTRTRPYVKE